MNYREELFKALTAGVDGVFRDKSIDALVEVCKAARKEGYNAGLEDGNINGLTEKITDAYTNGANDAWELYNELQDGYYDIDEKESIFGHINVEDIVSKLTGAEALAKLKEYKEKLKTPAFKVGDRVEVMAQKTRLSGESTFPVGTIGEISYIYDDGMYRVRTDSNWYDYTADEIELANDVIIIGDEVYLLDGNYHGVVTAVWEDCGVVKTERLTQSGKLACDDAKDLHRTGRRFPEIAYVLKQMQEVS